MYGSVDENTETRGSQNPNPDFPVGNFLLSICQFIIHGDFIEIAIINDKKQLHFSYSPHY